MHTVFNINGRRLARICVILPALIILFSCGNHDTNDTSGQSGSGDGWKPLFDGKTTSGWRGVKSDSFPAKGWEVNDGTLIVNPADGEGSGNGGDIITTERFGNFVLEWEWRMLTKGGNSGVKYFVNEYQADNKKDWLGLEYQILDDENFSWMQDGRMKPGDYRTLASLYEIYPAPDKTPKPLGEWNTSRIVAHGSHVEHWLNGEMVLQYERGSEDFRQKVSESKFAGYANFGEATEGHILLQDHGSRMAFRNIRIKILQQP